MRDPLAHAADAGRSGLLVSFVEATSDPRPTGAALDRAPADRTAYLTMTTFYNRPLPITAVCLAAGLMGCTWRHAVDFSDWPEPTEVALPCGETFKVYDFDPKRRLVVESGIARELFRSSKDCKDFEQLRTPGERLAHVARQHLATAHPGCDVGQSQALSASQYAFPYTCGSTSEGPKRKGPKVRS